MKIFGRQPLETFPKDSPQSPRTQCLRVADLSLYLGDQCSPSFMMNAGLLMGLSSHIAHFPVKDMAELALGVGLFCLYRLRGTVGSALFGAEPVEIGDHQRKQARADRWIVDRASGIDCQRSQLSLLDADAHNYYLARTVSGIRTELVKAVMQELSLSARLQSDKSRFDFELHQEMCRNLSYEPDRNLVISILNLFVGTAIKGESLNVETMGKALGQIFSQAERDDPKLMEQTRAALPLFFQGVSELLDAFESQCAYGALVDELSKRDPSEAWKPEEAEARALGADFSWDPWIAKLDGIATRIANQCFDEFIY